MNRRLTNTGDGIPLTIDEVPLAPPPAKGVVVKTAFCGICRTDAEVWQHRGEFPVPVVQGHEISGTVHSLGRDAMSDYDLVVGDRVVVNVLGGCRKCPVCQAGSQLCRKLRSPESLHYGFTRDGGYQQYVVIDDASLLVRVPASVPFDLACLLPCSGLTSYSAVVCLRDSVMEAIRIKGEANVLVIGTGSLGLFAIYNVGAMLPPGVRVCAVDVVQEKLTQATKASAKHTVLWNTSDDVAANVAKVTDAIGDTFDGCLDFVGSANSVTTGIKSLDQNGTIAVVGAQFNGETTPVDFLELTIHNKRIQGVQAGSQKQLTDLVDMVARQGAEVMQENITSVKPEKVNGIFQDILSNRCIRKYIIEF